MMGVENYLIDNYSEEIVDLLNEINGRSHVSLNIDLTKLQRQNLDWFEAILDNVQYELPKWDAALLAAQKAIVSKDDSFLEPEYQIKVKCHARFVRFPAADPRFKIPFPNCDQVGQFREITGNVVRMTVMKLLELKREFVCSKCKRIIVVSAEYGLMYRFEVPKQCSSGGCTGTVHQKSSDPEPNYCVNYQEIKIQEALSDKNIPPTITITLENDLVDSCQPGDCVTVCGTIERRWITFQQDRPCRAIVSVRAVSLTREQNHLTVNTKHMSEQMLMMQFEWAENLETYGELQMRDTILESICPEIYGMYPIKLAIALAICSGNNEDFENKSADKLHHRGQSHVLLIGDPGLAKSKLLLSAVSMAPRAVHTTGMGCSSAGLTAAAIKEGGEWQLEAGALVLADGGVCCIDEFNLMKESDRASIHEAMEQQTISMAKAGIVCKLNTRCSIIAAANPKNLYSMSEPEGPSAINIGIASPLLSRFDLVFILRDERIPEWDSEIADHLLAQVCNDFEDITIDKNANLWSTQKLQSHFANICNVKPLMSDEAKEIIGEYFRRCRNDPQRDSSRSTVRLLDSLHRLAEAHARLLFRNRVIALDAIVVIRLMESTFGFGRIVQPYDVIKEELPLGPDDNEINTIYKILQLGEYDPIKYEIDDNNKLDEATQSLKRSYTTASLRGVPIEPVSGEQSVLSEVSGTKPSESQPPVEFKRPEIGSLRVFQTHPGLSRSSTSQKVIEPASVSDVTPKRPSYDDEELDRILSLDDCPAQTATEICNDAEDDVLSQVLESVEQSQRSPLPKFRKITAKPPNRLHFGPKKFLFQPSKKSNGNATAVEQPTEVFNESIRNRLFCTPSDDESTQQPVTSTQLDQPEKSKLPPKENDSAYDTMSLPSTESLPGVFDEQNTSVPTAAKTTPLFPPCTSKTTADQDLSFLDTLEF